MIQKNVNVVRTVPERQIEKQAKCGPLYVCHRHRACNEYLSRQCYARARRVLRDLRGRRSR